MNAFDDARSVEQESLNILRPMLDQRSLDGKWVLTAKGRLAKELQRTYGDVLMQSKNGDVQAVELKAERELSRNVFLEEWSNRSRFTRGWMEHLRCDFLLYHFIAADMLLVIKFPALKEWAYCCDHGGTPNLYRFPMKVQGRRQQMNDTWGVCVPIDALPPTVLVRRLRPSAFHRVPGETVDWVQEYEAAEQQVPA